MPSKAHIKNIYSLSDISSFSVATEKADVIVDAIFGVGFHGELPSPEREAVMRANITGAIRVAVDIPSGMDSDSGAVGEVCFNASLTLTMAYVKRGCLIYPARSYCGRIVVCSIGTDMEKVEKDLDFPFFTVDVSHIKKYVLNRPVDSHKGTFGRLMMICGSDSMTGAAVLACEGALRMGVGLCELVCTENVARVVGTRCPEVIFTIVPSVDAWDNTVYEKILMHSVDADAIVIGCGCTSSKNLERVIEVLSSIRGGPMLIDADGINCLDGRSEYLHDACRDILITPHPKEFARLSMTDMYQILCDRYSAAERMAVSNGITVLLKGASTVICRGDGAGCVNVTGNSGLARGGSGDVLSGIIGALLAKGVDTMMSAAIGAHLHGAAADILASRYTEVGVLPRDLPQAIGEYLKTISE